MQTLEKDVLIIKNKFGTYNIPLDPNKIATYVCPANKKIKNKEHSHDRFFGYNIRRVIKAFRNKN